MKKIGIDYNNIIELTQEEIYKLMDNSDFVNAYAGKEKYSAQFAALDSQQRIIAVGTEPRAEAKAIMRGCISPRVINLGYFNKKDIIKHNEQLQKTLESALKRKITQEEFLFPYEHPIKKG